jgi:hypothetical protein
MWLRHRYPRTSDLHIDFLHPNGVSHPIYQERLRLFRLAALASATTPASYEAPLQAPPDSESLQVRYALIFGHPPVEDAFAAPPVVPTFAPPRRDLDDPGLPPQAPLPDPPALPHPCNGPPDPARTTTVEHADPVNPPVDGPPPAPPALPDANSGTPTHVRPTTTERKDPAFHDVDVGSDGYSSP